MGHEPTPKLDRLLTVEETAAIFRKSPSQMRWMIHAGTAPKSGKVGGRRMFRESDVDAYIEAAFNGTQVAS